MVSQNNNLEITRVGFSCPGPAWQLPQSHSDLLRVPGSSCGPGAHPRSERLDACMCVRNRKEETGVTGNASRF